MRAVTNTLDHYQVLSVNVPGQQHSGSNRRARSSRRNNTSKKTGGNRKKRNHHGSSKSTTAKQWKNLAPAKSIFSKRAKKTALMIDGIQLILDNPDEPEIASILQASYTKLSEQLTKLDNSDSEALSLVLKHPALCSNSEVRIKNVVALCDHIKERGYPELITKGKAILQHIEVMLKNLADTQPLAPRRKTSDETIINPRVQSALQALPSTSESDNSQDHDHQRTHSNKTEKEHTLSSPSNDNQDRTPSSPTTSSKDDYGRSPTKDKTGNHFFPKSSEPNGPILTGTQPTKGHQQDKDTHTNSKPTTTAFPNDNTSEPEITYEVLETLLRRFSEKVKVEVTETIHKAVQKVDKKVETHARHKVYSCNLYSHEKQSGDGSRPT
ncbi:hypothetical protein CRE_15849 [Caenorhabditis remanei]|uniref:Uncharacterized protein n=1 Tax=Caenorhabditis remanei TaxID=31234 RepID=E3NUN2_CAERE|nr:hypothetical protein CRE_15849 [Caenorhabditis remanei]